MKPSVPFAALISAVLAAPMPARETCACQPLRASSPMDQGYDESLTACNRIANDVERWRAAAFHRTHLADLFVDYEALELSKTLGIQPLSEAEKKYLRQLDGFKLSRFFLKTRRSLPSWTSNPRNPVSSGSSLGRAAHGRTAARLRVSPQKFKIFCQPSDVPYDVRVPTPVLWIIASFFLMALMWLCLFELLVDIWLRITSRRRAKEGTIMLLGTEKVLSACEQRQEPTDT